MYSWDERLIEFASRRFALLAEPMRLRILQLLEHGETSVGEIAQSLGSTQPNASRHLQALYREEILARRRAGTVILYSIADPVIQEICTLMCGRLGGKSFAATPPASETAAPAAVPKKSRSRRSPAPDPRPSKK